jgi:polysaccharide export outer membrane protein
MKALCPRSAVVVLFAVSMLASVAAQQQPSAPPKPANGNPAAPTGATVPAGYVIGAEDVLTIVFWRDKEMSAEVVVRPDGKISLPLINDVQAAGYTPEQLRAELEKAAAKFVAEPNATVVVRQINSRKVYITGNVAKPGTYPLVDDMTVLQLIAVGGGLLEYADAKDIVVMRRENGKDRQFKFNYKDVVRQRNVAQNIVLKPGDTVVVP